MKTKLLSISILLFSVSVSDAAPLSLRDAISMALERNHLVKAAGLEKRAAKHGTKGASSRYFPRVTLSESAAASNSPTRVFMMKLDQGRFTQGDFGIGALNSPATGHDFTTGVSIEQTLLDFTVKPAVELARLEESGVSLALQRRREEIALSVTAEYVSVGTAKARLAAAEKGLADAREHLRLAAARREAGTGLKSDELRGRTSLSEAEQRKIAAENDLLLARLRLARLCGADGETVDIGELAGIPETPAGTDLVRHAAENRTELREAENLVKKAEAGDSLARRSYLPTVTLRGDYRMDDHRTPFGRDNDSWEVGAALRWEIFDGFRRKNELEKARSLREAAAEYLEDARQEVRLQVTEQRLRRDEEKQKLEAARRGVADAEESVRMIARRYENSLATMSELLDAQAALDAARSRVVEQEGNVVLAGARLLHAAGMLLTEVTK